jgi:quercetin dioxygenase-like cupin family protein
MKSLKLRRFCRLTLIIFFFPGMGLVSPDRAMAQEPVSVGHGKQAKILVFHPDSVTYQCLFDGPKDSTVFYSGVVTLLPGQTVGEHDSEVYEEMIVILAGRGHLLTGDGKSYEVGFGNVAYCPPHTVHNMKNTGTENLKYIYIATRSSP